MDFDKIVKFANNEHERLVTRFDAKDNPKTKYTMLAKLMEEMGELSEAILKNDSLQRSDKKKEIGEIDYEIADVILCSLVLAKELNVEVEKAIIEKMKKIKLRKY
jgi:NTP pyrophosphatase (non-canonical NTP hydrolase)